MIIHGDCLEQLKLLDSNSVDSVVTDPPAGISFMGKEWDSDKGGRDEWIAWLASVMRECHRVLKPGGHGLVWAIPRTSHWTGTALELAGFEVRDVITHLFGSGFPKSLDVSKAIDKAAGARREVVGENPNNRDRSKHNYNSVGNVGSDAVITAPATDAAKQWAGWGTALKPAAEFWFLIRKPCSEKTVAANVLKHGTGALNIDGSRVASQDKLVRPEIKRTDNEILGKGLGAGVQVEPQGRFPANLILDEEAARLLDEQSGILSGRGNVNDSIQTDNGMFGKGIIRNSKGIGKTSPGGASRFFYCAKVSPSERGDSKHPTMKSLNLMRYLCKLITPPGGTVLDPFAGSGSTGLAALQEGFKFLGIEKEDSYVTIARARIAAAIGPLGPLQIERSPSILPENDTADTGSRG